MLRIWGRRTSFNVQKVMWLVGELGLPHEHIAAGGRFGRLNDADFRAMNPHGRIPVIDDGGTLILAGLLEDQADRVAAAYRAQGMRLVDRIDGGHWPTLRFRKRPTIGWRRPRRWAPDANGEAPGYGSW